MDHWEAKLAAEGSALDEHERTAFALQFALATDAVAKRALVEHRFVPGSPDAVYFGALCVLLDIQALLEQQTLVGNEAAKRMLEEKAALLDGASTVLESKGCTRKLSRVRQRRMLLDLEAYHRQGSSSEHLKELGNRLAETFDVEIKANNSLVNPSASVENLPSTLDESEVSTSGLIDYKWTSLKTLPLGKVKPWMNSACPLSYEILLSRIAKATSEAIPPDVLSALIEEILDGYTLAHTNFPGFVDIVIEDVRRESLLQSNRGFNFRAAHAHMPISQLQQCLEQEPSLFRDNVEFARRGVYLISSAAAQEVDDLRAVGRSEESMRLAIRVTERCLDFLSQFSADVKDLRRETLLKELQHRHMMHLLRPDTAAELLQGLVAYAQSVGQVNCPAPEYASNYTVRAAMAGMASLQIDEAVGTVVSALFGSALDPAAIADALRQYVGHEWLETHEALAAIKLGKGDITAWIDKLPEKGSELETPEFTAPIISFCESNPSYFAPDEPLLVHVCVRNVETLTAHLYEIKTEEYYSRLRHNVQENVRVDGLLPNKEVVLDLSYMSKLQEARLPIEFSLSSHEANKRGVYVVEVMGKGIKCRAILRRGFLRHVERVTSHGHELLVLDEEGNVLRDTRAVVLDVTPGRSRTQQGREYEADEQGLVKIPFRPKQNGSSSDQFALILCLGSFGAFKSSFKYIEEKFDLRADMHIDAEKQIPGGVAEMVTKLGLTVGDTSVSLERLVNLEVTVMFRAGDRNEQCAPNYKQQFSSAEQFLRSPVSFMIPNEADSFIVELTAELSKMDPVDVISGANSSPDLLNLSSSNRFEGLSARGYTSPCTPHFVRRPLEDGRSEFVLLVLGHNGESIPGVSIDIKVFNVHFHSAKVVKLRSDADGQVVFGELKDVHQITVSLPTVSERLFWSWELPNVSVRHLRAVNCCPGETIEQPIPRAYTGEVAKWLAAGMISLYEVIKVNGTTEEVLEPVTRDAHVTLTTNQQGLGTGIAARIDRPGSFLLFIRPLELKCSIDVCKLQQPLSAWGIRALLGTRKVLLATQRAPMSIASQTISKDGATGRFFMEVELRNAKANTTRVVVFVKRFLDVYVKATGTRFRDDSGSLVCDSRFCVSQTSFDADLLGNTFQTSRKISREYSYILERRALFESRDGDLDFSIGPCSVPKPSWIHSPFVDSISEMETEAMLDGDKAEVVETKPAEVFNDKRESRGRLSRMAMLSRSQSARLKRTDWPSIEFLRSGHGTCISGDVDSDGVARIPLDPVLSNIGLESDWTFEFVAVAMDDTCGQSCVAQMAAGLGHSSGTEHAVSFPKRDLRLSAESALPSSQHFHQTERHECLRAGEERLIDCQDGNAFAVYKSLGDVLSLWAALKKSWVADKLVKLLRTWFQQSTTEKTRVYYKHACDEFHFFLYKKDRVFFDALVKPQVASKMTKSLIDYCVLEDIDSLRSLYLTPSVFAKMSDIEKLLVAGTLMSTVETPRMCDAVVASIDCALTSSKDRVSLDRLFDAVVSHGLAPVRSEHEPLLVKNSRRCCMLGRPRLRLSRDTPLTSAPQVAPSYAPTSPAYSPTSPAFSPGGEPGEPKDESSSDSDIVDIDDTFGVESIHSDDGEEDPITQGTKRLRRKTAPDTAYLPPGKVRRVEETRFTRNMTPELTGANNFWREYACYVKSRATSRLNAHAQPFLSSYFPEALSSLSSLTEDLITISVLDLPIDPPPSEAGPVTDSQKKLVAASDLILYHRCVVLADVNPNANSELIIQQKIVSGSESDTSGCGVGEVEMGKVYSAVVKVANITESDIRGVHVLLQIPRGAIALSKQRKKPGFQTKSVLIAVKANASRTFRFNFCFPEAGEFDFYPAHASRNGLVVAWAGASETDDASRKVRVIKEATRVNLLSWSDVSSRGSLDDVCQYMSRTKPSEVLPMTSLRSRCQDAEFYFGIVAFFREKLRFDHDLWKYAVRHGDAQGIKELLESSDKVTRSAGNGLSTALFTSMQLYDWERFVDAPGGFDHIEFGPLLSRRADPTAGQSSALAGDHIGRHTEPIRHQETCMYLHELCFRLGMYSQLSPEHLMVLVYYLLLLDRTNTAVRVFVRFEALPESERERVSGTVQFDYLSAYIDLARSHRQSQGLKFAVARRAAKKHAEHPNPRWSERFKKLVAVLQEHDEFEVHTLHRLDDVAMSERSTHLDNTTVSMVINNPSVLQVKLEAQIVGESIELSAQCLRACDVLFYPIDVEQMFSIDPFSTLRSGSASASHSLSSALFIEPRRRLSVDLMDEASVRFEGGWTKCAVAIPNDLRSAQMMIRVLEAPASRTIESLAPPMDATRTYFNSRLQVTTMPQPGLLQVLLDNVPVRSCYVKAYAKLTPSSSSSSTSSTSSKEEKEKEKAASRCEFYKDGYTDLLGKFDYVATNGDLIKEVEAFSILVSHPDLGATVVTVAPPVLASTTSDFALQEAKERLLY